MEDKKYSEMTFEEFLTGVVGFKLTEQQLHMVTMFEEIKAKKYANNNWLSNGTVGIRDCGIPEY